jgi:hypothetical protein
MGYDPGGQILGVGWRLRCTKRELMSRQQLLTRYARKDRVPR